MIEIGDYKFWMDGYFKSSMDIILNEAIPNKWDAVFIVFGKEGTGKTTLTSQAAIYCDHKFDIDRCEFTPEQFQHVIDNCPDESSIIWDEAITGAVSVAHASKVSQAVVSKLTQIRKKRLKIFLCFPYLWMLNRYFVSRCAGSFYVYSHGFTKRGFAFAYNQEQTEYLYALMKDKYRLQPLRALSRAAKSYRFKFPDVFCMDKALYDNKKEKFRMVNEEADPWKEVAIRWAKLCVEKGVTQSQLAKCTRWTQQYIQMLLSNHKQNIVI